MITRLKALLAAIAVAAAVLVVLPATPADVVTPAQTPVAEAGVVGVGAGPTFNHVTFRAYDTFLCGHPRSGGYYFIGHGTHQGVRIDYVWRFRWNGGWMMHLWCFH